MTVEETIECLKMCPQDDILMVMGDKLESIPVDDVLYGGGIRRGFSYIKPEHTKENNGDKIRNMSNRKVRDKYDKSREIEQREKEEAERLKRELDRVNLLEEYSTTQLKKELRRRKQEHEKRNI